MQWLISGEGNDTAGLLFGGVIEAAQRTTKEVQRVQTEVCTKKSNAACV